MNAIVRRPNPRTTIEVIEALDVDAGSRWSASLA